MELWKDICSILISRSIGILAVLDAEAAFRETALPQAGMLQLSAGDVSHHLCVDYLGPSEAPLSWGGWTSLIIPYNHQ